MTHWCEKCQSSMYKKNVEWTWNTTECPSSVTQVNVEWECDYCGNTDTEVEVVCNDIE